MIDENWDRDYLKRWLGKYLLKSPYTIGFGSDGPRYTKIIVNGIDCGTSPQGDYWVFCLCSVYKTTSRFEDPDSRQFTVPYDYVKSHMIKYMREEKLNDLLERDEAIKNNIPVTEEEKKINKG